MNGSAVPMADADLAIFLVAAARDAHQWDCPIPECESCSRFRRLWWDTYHRIGHDYKMSVRLTLTHYSTPPPVQEVGDYNL